MKKLFIHNLLFRFLSPLFSGTLVYLLILLINNNIGQIEAYFLGQELYVCIGLAYLIQEYARLSLLFFKRLKRPTTFVWKLLLQLLFSVIICIFLVTLAMYLYFTIVLGYSPNDRELLIFNSIFSFITIIYVMLYVSHQFLFKVNTNRMEMEESEKLRVEADFIQFKKDINPKLLFETLEALLMLMKRDPEAAEQLTDHFSAVYRYILSNRKDELVSIEEEIGVLKELIQLMNSLPFRRVQLEKVEVSETLVVPGCLLVVLERILRSTIPSENTCLSLDILEDQQTIVLQYIPEETIRENFEKEHLADITNHYKFYTALPISVSLQPPYKLISIPKLSLDESSHY